MVASHQYAKHMPNVLQRHKLLLISVLLAAAKNFDFASIPRMGFSCPVLGWNALFTRTSLAIS